MGVTKPNVFYILSKEAREQCRNKIELTPVYTSLEEGGLVYIRNNLVARALGGGKFRYLNILSDRNLAFFESQIKAVLFELKIIFSEEDSIDSFVIPKKKSKQPSDLSSSDNQGPFVLEKKHLNINSKGGALYGDPSEHIKEIMKKMGYSQKDIAQRTGLNYGTVIHPFFNSLPVPECFRILKELSTLESIVFKGGITLEEFLPSWMQEISSYTKPSQVANTTISCIQTGMEESQPQVTHVILGQQDRTIS